MDVFITSIKSQHQECLGVKKGQHSTIIVLIKLQTYLFPEKKKRSLFFVSWFKIEPYNDWHVSWQEGGGSLEVFFMIPGRGCPMKSYLADRQSPDRIYKVQPTQGYNNSTYVTIEDMLFIMATITATSLRLAHLKAHCIFKFLGRRIWAHLGSLWVILCPI